MTAALSGPQSGVVLVRDLDQGLAVVDAYGAEHLEVHDPGRGGGGPPGPQRRLRLRRPALAGLARRLRRRLEPRAAHRRHLPAHRRAVGADVPARRQRGGVRPGRARRGGRARHRAGPRRGPARARGRGRRGGPAGDRAGGPPAAGRPARAVGVRGAAARRAGPAEHQRELPPAAGRPRSTTSPRWPGRRRPDSTATRTGRRPTLRADLAAYLGHGLAADRVWAANGSNEMLQQLLQAFGGPGRTALGFAPSYSMHEIIATGTGTAWVDGMRAADFTVPPSTGPSSRCSSTGPSVVFLTSPNNPTGTALPLATVEAVLDVAPGMVVVDEAYAEFARPGVPSRADPAAGAPAAGGHPDHVQGLRHGRAAARLPGRRPGGGRRAAAGPAAVPPLDADPAGRQGGAGARAGAAGDGAGGEGRAGPDRRRRCPRTG